MNLVIFECPSCNKRIFAEKSHAGRPGACPLCGKAIVVPGRVPAAAKKTDATWGRGVPATPGGAGVGSPGAGTNVDAPPPTGERRKTKRVPVNNARVVYETRSMNGQQLAPEDVPALDDISETGVGFSVKGEPSKKTMTRVQPPSTFKVGDQIRITLQIPELFRPRVVKGVVRRVVPHRKQKELYRVGVEFEGVPDDIRKELRKLIERK